jgi:hypothetical protein
LISEPQGMSFEGVLLGHGRPDVARLHSREAQTARSLGFTLHDAAYVTIEPTSEGRKHSTGRRKSVRTSATGNPDKECMTRSN